jgi:hypothetical protein
MPVNSQDPHENIFSAEQEKIIKRSVHSFEKTLGITKETPDYLKRSFEGKLALLGHTKKPFAVSWKGFTASLLSAFSVGLLLSRLLMVPATVATRSVGEDSQAVQVSSAQEYVSFQVSNPRELAFNIIAIALDAELDVEVTYAGDKYGLYIKPFKPNVKKQDKLRSLLGISADSSGSVNVIIGSSKQ